MLLNLVLGTLIMLVCLVLQVIPLIFGARFYRRHKAAAGSRSLIQELGLIGAVMMILVCGNLVQVGIWGALFQVLGEFDSFREAFYHSMVNFATLGYGDIVMSPEHRVLGPFEAMNGVFMIGVSASALTAAMQDVLRRSRSDA